MTKNKNIQKESILSSVKPSKAIIDLAVPAILALLAKAVYNIVDTVYIGMLGSDTALAAVGVTLPLLLIMVSIENIFAAGAGVLAGRQLGANDREAASRTVTTIVGFSMMIGAGLCITGLIFMEVLLRAFGASDAVLPQARDYAFWNYWSCAERNPGSHIYVFVGTQYGCRGRVSCNYRFTVCYLCYSSDFLCGRLLCDSA